MADTKDTGVDPEVVTEETAVAADPIVVVNTTNIEVIEPVKAYIDQTEDKKVSEFEKIVESVEDLEGVITTVRKIVPMTYEEKLAKRIQTLKEKVIDGTITGSERDDLRLLIS